MALRFRVASIQHYQHIEHNLVDLHTQRILAVSRDESDAAFICNKLNSPDRSADRRVHGLLVMEIADFRMNLEHDNGGPLTSDPQLALFLDDLCNFLQFNTGEKALALGPSLLVYLSFLSSTPTDSIVAEQTLEGDQVRVG
jgi:hypothetical protein